MAIDQTFVGLPTIGFDRAGAGGHPCQGLYHAPTARRPEVAFIATHYNIDFAEHYLGPYLAELGFGFLGWNTRFRGDEAHFVLDHALVDIGVGVRWLREQAGVERVVLLGNSGGGSLMAAYQSQAVEPNVPPAFGARPAPGADELVPCDAYIALAAHPGRPDVLTAWMDAASTDEFDPAKTDRSLDLWNPDNGPPYSDEFLTSYRAAQVARNERITAWVLAELERLPAAGQSDRLFTTARLWADPRMIDPTIDPNARTPNSCYLGDPAWVNRSTWGVGQCSSLRTWLSMWSLEHSPCRAEPHLARITVPSLVVSADGDAGVFPSDARQIHDALAATDKQLVEVTGDHYLRTPDNARPDVARLLSEWTSAHL